MFVEQLAPPEIVSMIGQMFSPKLLSMPPVPSSCVTFAAPAASVHTSVDVAVVQSPSRL